MMRDREDVRLTASRCAAKLFLERGLSGVSGDDIAACAGLSTRSVWRYFGTKEGCVAPLLQASSLRFIAELRRWPREASIEAHLHQCFRFDRMTPQEIADSVVVARLVAMMPDEPALRGVWLLSCHEGEEEMVAIIADRLDRSVNDFEVRLCAAAVAAAIRVVDETISFAAIRRAQKFTLAETVDQMARTIRAASTLPICDPVVADVFGRKT